MKSLLFILAFGSLFFHSCTSSNNQRVVENQIQNIPVDNRYVINGILKGPYEGYIYMQRGEEKDSTLVTDDVFCFEGEVDNPKQYYFNLGEGSRIFWLHVEATEINLTTAVRMDTLDDGSVFPNFVMRNVNGTKSYPVKNYYHDLYEFTKDHPKQDSILLTVLDSLSDLYPRYELIGNRIADLATHVNDEGLKDKLQEVYGKLDSSTQDKYWRKTFRDNIARLELLSLGNQFPDFELMDQNGDLISLSDLKAKVTLVDFWATWCSPCIQKISEYRSELAPLMNGDFQIVSIALDDDEEKWKKVIKDRGMNWGNLIDADKWDAKLVKDLYIDHIPVSYVINRDGKIIGYKSDINEIKRLLRGVPN